MNDYPLTVESVKEQLDVEDIFYATDIGSNAHYGIGVKGTIDVAGERVRVLGSLVLDETSGNPVTGHDENAIVAYPDGTLSGGMTLLGTDEAVCTVMDYFSRTHNSSSAFLPRRKTLPVY
jgi:hypothetical protein